LPHIINSQAHYTKGTPKLSKKSKDCLLIVTFHRGPNGYAIGLPFLRSTCSLSITDFRGPFRTGSSYLHADLHVFDITKFIFKVLFYGTLVTLYGFSRSFAITTKYNSNNNFKYYYGCSISLATTLELSVD